MGTMTFGTQCDEKLSFDILDRAYDAGIDFYDAAEMYPVPPTAALFGRTEEIVGRWLKTKPRDSVIVATKITGPAHGWFVPPVRHGHSALDRVQIRNAVEASLRRLQTDTIDLYQTHWPDHGARYEEVLEPLTTFVRQGKIRVIGCSNETCWGLMKSLSTAEKFGLQRFDTVQNNFSLINRRCESELAQVCRRENVSLLPFSPLGGGVLTGKYTHGDPPGARFTEYRRLGERQQKLADRFLNDRTRDTVNRLQVIADDLGISLTAMCVAWSKQHDFVASTIIGATTVAHLNESLAADGLVLSRETLNRIDEIDVAIPNPMKEDGLRRL
jgi:aryl-alcohol dehydrogenase-like predicted oxidoreductase